jgi:RNA polymerase sigma-70 factor (ECF subfamily)
LEVVIVAEVVEFQTKQSFEQVYEECYDKIYKYTYTLLMNKEDTEDVVADTFITAYEKYDTYDSTKSSVSTWLSRIAHNKAVNLVRSASYRNRDELPEELPGEASADFTKNVEDNEMLINLYSNLTEDEREFLNLRYTMGLKDAEVAEILDISPKAVNKRYQRLLAKCKDILND